MKRLGLLSIVLFFSLSSLWAVTTEMEVLHVLDDGTTEEIDSIDNLPYRVKLYANAEIEDTETDFYDNVSYKWVVYKDGETYITRYDAVNELDLNTTGKYTFALTIYLLYNGVVQDSIYDNSFESLTIKESLLTMPNAFSPNGDGFNDIYKPIKYQSLRSFHAYIYNRWGNLLYDWTDPSTGWDGTYKGRDVKNGVYFCLVKAEGSDGIKYNIKKDVTLLRGYYNEESTSE